MGEGKKGRGAPVCAHTWGEGVVTKQCVFTPLDGDFLSEGWVTSMQLGPLIPLPYSILEL